MKPISESPSSKKVNVHTVGAKGHAGAAIEKLIAIVLSLSILLLAALWGVGYLNESLSSEVNPDSLVYVPVNKSYSFENIHWGSVRGHLHALNVAPNIVAQLPEALPEKSDSVLAPELSEFYGNLYAYFDSNISLVVVIVAFLIAGLAGAGGNFTSCITGMVAAGYILFTPALLLSLTGYSEAELVAYKRVKAEHASSVARAYLCAQSGCDDKVKGQLVYEPDVISTSTGFLTKHHLESLVGVEQLSPKAEKSKRMMDWILQKEQEYAAKLLELCQMLYGALVLILFVRLVSRFSNSRRAVYDQVNAPK